MITILLHTGERRSRVEEPLTYAGFNVVGIPEKHMKSNKVIKLFYLVKILIKEDPDLIVIDSAGLMCISAYLLSILFRIPLAIRARADIWAIYEEQKGYQGIAGWIYEGLFLAFCTAIYRKATRIFSISEYLKTIMIKKGIEKGKIYIMRISIDYNRFKPLKSEKKSINLLSVVNFTYKMKTQGLLDILPEVDELISRYPIEYFIAGRGRFSSLLEDAIDGMKHPDRIHYVGFEKAIETLFSRADIYVHYSHLDAYPAAVLEAMSSGLPVVASRSGGMVEQIDQGITGFLVDDPSTFRNAVERLIDNEKLRREMGKKGRAYVKDSCTVPSISRQYERGIEGITKEKKNL